MTIFGLVFSTIDIWLIGLAGALIMAWIGFLLTDTQNRKTRFSQASATFHSKVLTELEGLYPIPSGWPQDGIIVERMLKEKFPRLQTAVAEFGKSLPWYKQKGFNKAWFIYRLGEDGREIDIQCYHQYMPFGSNPNFKENFKHNVDNLLKFSKLT